jgi:hypothetical protein
MNAVGDEDGADQQPRSGVVEAKGRVEVQHQRREPLDDEELARSVSVAPDKPADPKQILGCFGAEACRRLRELGGTGRQ